MIKEENHGFCVPYLPLNYDNDINDIFLEFKDQIDVNTILCHWKFKNRIKTGKPVGSYSKEIFMKIRDELKSKNIIFIEGKGSPSGICRGSNGFKIEHEKCDSLNMVNSKIRKKIINLLPSYKKKNIICFSGNYKENTRRPLKLENGKLKIDNNDIDNISDMRIYFHDDYNYKAGLLFNSKEYISQKSSGLVTFINLGINNKYCLKESYIKNNNITSELGICLLKTLGIDNDGFCGIFNKYANNNKLQIKNIADKHNKEIDFTIDSDSENLKNILQEFLNQCMGNGNMIISHYIYDKDIIYRSKKLDNTIEKYNIYYGGKKGTGKRIDIEIYTKSLLFNINIRNKQGGIYPSHIMCDFKYHNDQMLI